MNTVQTRNSLLYFHYLLASYQEMTCKYTKGKGSDASTFKVQVKGIQLNFDTLCMPMHISDKPDSKALLLLREGTFLHVKTLLTPYRARDEGLHTNRRAVNTRFG